jgi:hypothetical protein
VVREHALFLGDNLSVLSVADAYSIGQIFAISKPDPTQPVRRTAELLAVQPAARLLQWSNPVS